MADYRGWCQGCGAEINFGSCKPDCPIQAKIVLQRKELQDWTNQQFAKMDAAGEDSMIELMDANNEYLELLYFDVRRLELQNKMIKEWLAGRGRYPDIEKMRRERMEQLAAND